MQSEKRTKKYNAIIIMPKKIIMPVSIALAQL